MPRIHALPPMTTLAGSDEIPIVDVSESTTKKVTFSMMIPAGVVWDWAGANAPAGWLLCYGQSLNATSNPEYADLYAAIGVTFGGTGITDFRLPDARGRVIAGADAMGGTAANRLTTAGLGVTAVRGAVGGLETHTLSMAQIPSFYLVLSHHGDEGGSVIRQFTAGNGTSSAISYPGSYKAPPGSTGGASSIQSPQASWGGGGAHNNTQPTLVMNKIIKF